MFVFWLFFYFVFVLVRACPNRIEIENRTMKKKNRALMVSWFKHVPLRFLGSEKIHRLQPIAKIKTLSAENRKSKRKHEQQQFSVSYWSAQPPQDITSGLPYTTHNPLPATATQPHRSPVNSQQANHNNCPDVVGPLFPSVRAKAKRIGIIST